MGKWHSSTWIPIVSIVVLNGGCLHLKPLAPWPEHLSLTQRPLHPACPPELSIAAVGEGREIASAERAAEVHLIEQIATQIKVVIRQARRSSMINGSESVENDFSQEVERKARFDHRELIEKVGSPAQRGPYVRSLACLDRPRARRALDQEIRQSHRHLKRSVQRTRRLLRARPPRQKKKLGGLLGMGLGLAQQGVGLVAKEASGLNARGAYDEVKQHYAFLAPRLLQYRGIARSAHPLGTESHRIVAELNNEFQGSSLLNSLFDQGIAQWSRLWRVGR